MKPIKIAITAEVWRQPPRRDNKENPGLCNRTSAKPNALLKLRRFFPCFGTTTTGFVEMREVTRGVDDRMTRFFVSCNPLTVRCARR